MPADPTEVLVTVTIAEPWSGSGSAWKPIFGPGAIGTGRDLTNAAFTSGNESLVQIRNGDIHVKANVNMKFVFPQCSGSIPAFYPIGIGYYREGAGQNSQQQITSLPREDIRLGTANGQPYLLLHDTHVEQDSADGSQTVRWKYYLMVQDNYGNLGVIDPDIENDYEA